MALGRRPQMALGRLPTMAVARLREVCDREDLLEHPIYARPADAERFGDGRRSCAFILRNCAGSIEGGRLLQTPAAFALAIPSSWRSRRSLGSLSAESRIRQFL